MKQKIGLDLKVFSHNFAGIGRYCLNLTRHLIKRDNYEYLGFVSPLTDFESFNQLKIPKTGGLSQKIQSTLLRSYLILPLYLRRDRVDLFHSMDNSSISRSLNQNVGKVATIHDLIVFKYPQFFTKKHVKIVQFLIRSATFQADQIITDSVSTKKDLLQTFPNISETKVSVTHLACDEHIYRREEKEVALFMKQKKLPEKYFLTVGTFEPRKNLSYVIEAFLSLKKKRGYEAIHLLLAGGKGWMETNIEGKRKELGEKGVISLGFVSDDDLTYLYSGATAFIYASHYEGFGLPVLEAMSCGVPVITSNVSSLPEIVEDLALTCDPNSPETIQIAMEEILNDERGSKAMGEILLKRSKNFTWEKTAELTEKIYEKLF